MEYIDVHCHLDDDRLKNRLDEVIDNFRRVGGKFIITSGVNPHTNREILDIASKYPDMVKVSFGLYPIDSIAKQVKKSLKDDDMREIEEFDVDEELRWIEENKEKCVAIGEVGLDYKVVEGFEEEQKAVFSRVIDLAKKIDKPLVIHSRKAEADAINMLEEKECKRVLMHCFNGKKSLIRRARDLGWSFSVPAVITRLEHFRMLVDMVPIEQLVTETDAPYLSPVVGEVNESKNVAVTVKEIAKIKGMDEEEVAKVMFNNVKTFFNL
jgi:TatD DNase family protein